MPTSPAHIRNLAIIAHIDHGKTTLIDSIFRAAHTFRENARVEERVMDSNDLERERGITIRSKHCTVDWNFYLFLEIGASDEQADFPVLYGSGLEGWLVRELEDVKSAGVASPSGMDDLFQTIVEHVPAPKVDTCAPFRMQVSSLAWSDYIGRIGCGRVLSGTHRQGEQLLRTSTAMGTTGGEVDWTVTATETSCSSHLFVTQGLERADTDE